MKIKERLSGFAHGIVNGMKKKSAVFFGSAFAMSLMSVAAFAVDESSSSGSSVSGSDALQSVVVTTDMLSPIVDIVAANVKVILPVGIIIFGMLLGIGLIRGILKRVSGA